MSNTMLKFIDKKLVPAGIIAVVPAWSAPVDS
jgi:hypothetical protein